MKWPQVNIKEERLNGLKLRVAQTIPETTIPKFLDHILEESGIELITEQELGKRTKKTEMTAK